MSKRVQTAIFPVAGMGTRFLPATKSMPKEMLPLVDRPLIQYAIDEAREAGIKEFIFVTARGKSSLEDYFDSHYELERALEAKGKTELLAEVNNATMPSGAIAYIRQQEALGLGHAVWCARRLVGNQPFAVILPDDVIKGPRGCMAQMVDAYEARGQGGCMVAAEDVPTESTSAYGILNPRADDGRVLEVAGMVEKPKANPPSNTAVIGRYILTPAVMDFLDQKKPGAGGEIQLTDAIAAQVDAPGGVVGLRFDGRRYDCGSKQGFLQATVAFALMRPDLAGEFAQFLRNLDTGDIAA
ncbi:MAG: UTP--glucose-1-phosphate uridylyltransferase [Pseudomonadota bacterium]